MEERKPAICDDIDGFFMTLCKMKEVRQRKTNTVYYHLDVVFKKNLKLIKYIDLKSDFQGLGR